MENIPPINEEQIVEELSGILQSTYEAENYEELHKKILDFVNNTLHKEFSEKYLQGIRLYHMLIGSSIPKAASDFDIPGGRIETFIRTEL